MTTVMNVSSALLIATVGFALARDNGHPQTGCCPKTTDGWILFQDSTPTTPYFWHVESVVVDAVDSCEHGVYFFFFSIEHSEARYVSLVIVKPTRMLYETRVRVRQGDPPLDDRLHKAQTEYGALLKRLDDIFGSELSSGKRLQFDSLYASDSPIINVRRTLALKWRGQTCKLRGYLDVYMTLHL